MTARTVSVAMATYDGERYLPEMLASLDRQSLLPAELVVRDDGSSDGTLDVLREFAAGAPFPVRVLPAGERLGYAQNFMAVTRECVGNVVFFADQDDLWRPEKLATVVAAATPGEPEALFHDLALVDAEGRETQPSFVGLLRERGFGPAVALKGCSIAVTREFLEGWGWPPADSPVSHDFWVALLSTAFAQRRYLTEVLVDHRLHDENASGWMPSQQSREFTEPGEDDDVAVLVDLVVKAGKARRFTRDLVDALDARGDRIDPEAATRLRRTLRRNRRRHREAREALSRDPGA
ncbi:MAG: glycosyltransferase [Nocardioides sp.]